MIERTMGFGLSTFSVKRCIRTTLCCQNTHIIAATAKTGPGNNSEGEASFQSPHHA